MSLISKKLFPGRSVVAALALLSPRRSRFKGFGRFGTLGLAVLPLVAGAVLAAPTMAHAQLAYLSKFGTYDQGMVVEHWGVALDSHANVFVTDAYRGVHKFDKDGNYISLFAGREDYNGGPLKGPLAVAIDSSDNVYVADEASAHDVKKFDKDGNLLVTFGGSGDPRVSWPRGIAVDNASGTVFVSNTNSALILKYDTSGNYIGSLSGTNTPRGLAVAGGFLYAVSGNGGVNKYDISSGTIVKHFGDSLHDTQGVAVDNSGNVYVTDEGGNKRLYMFDSNGNLVSKIGNDEPFGDGGFAGPRGMAVNNTTNRLYIADWYYKRVSIINTRAQAATVTAVSPSSVLVGSSNTQITVTGTGFTPGSLIRTSSNPLTTTYVNATTLKATLPSSKLASIGYIPINVYIGGIGPSNSLTFTVTNPVPTLATISPNQVGMGSPDTTITLKGTNFVAGSRVMYGTQSLPVTFVDSNTLTAVVPARRLTVLSTGTINVVNPTPGGTSANVNFSVVSPAPTISSLSVSSVVEGSSATSLTITGTGFVPSSKVKFGTNSLTTTYVSATQLSVEIPAVSLATVGTYAITVTNPTGGTSGATSFQVSPRATTLELDNSVPASVTRNGSNLIVKVGLKNTGAYTARGIVIDSAVLGSTSSTSVSASNFTVAPGTTKLVVLTFPAASVTRGVSAKVSFNYTSTNAGSGVLSQNTAKVP